MAYTLGNKRKIYIAAPIEEPVTQEGAEAVGDENVVCKVMSWSVNQTAAQVAWDDNCGHQILPGVISRTIDITFALDEDENYYDILNDAFDNHTKVFVAQVNGFLGDSGTKGVAGNASVLDVSQPSASNTNTTITAKLVFLSADFVRIA